MSRYAFFFLLFLFFPVCMYAQNVKADLRGQWLKFENGDYQALGKDEPAQNTIYLQLNTGLYPGCYFSVASDRSFFVFVNGKLCGEYQSKAKLALDSLATRNFTSVLLLAVYQPHLNSRGLTTTITATQAVVAHDDFVQEVRPSTYFRDFVTVSGLVIIILFLVTVRLNPKLASDYFSVTRIFSLREGDDAQSNARLTSSTNMQFYVICSLLLGFYLMIVLHHLPGAYALPRYFQSHSFASALWQWIRLSTLILGFFFLKILLIFSLTRLFGLRGLARIHFFNWMRILLIVFGAGSTILFIYFISRGHQASLFTVFLAVVIGTLTGWIILVFLKLSGKTEHTMFHLFSYICATEIIPLLITVKVLFQ